MKILVREVVRIEEAEAKNGNTYFRAIIKTDKGESKLPLFGALEANIQAPGHYKIQYDDSQKPWKAVSAEAVDGQPEPVTKTVSNAPKQPVKAPGSPASPKNGPQPISDYEARKERSIAAAVILKATAEVVAATGCNSDGVKESAGHIFKAFASLYEGYIAEPKKIEEAAKELEESTPF